MTVEWIDSCQIGLLNTQGPTGGPAQRGYLSTGSISLYTTSDGQSYLRMYAGGGNQNAYRNALPANATYTVNGHLMLSNASVDAIGEVLWFNDADTRHFDVRVDTTGALYVTRNGTTLETGAAGAFVSNVPRWVSVRVTIGDAGVCSYEVWIDGVLYINNGGASADTRNAGTAQVTRVGFGDVASTGARFTYWGDIIICSGNQILGDSKVEALAPSGAGNSAQFTPSAGSNYQNVDELNPNNDTDYNVDNISGHEDTLALGSPSLAVSSVIAIQEVTRHRKDAAGALSIRQVIRTASTDYDNGTDIALSTSYAYSVKVRETSPAGGAWSESAINALEAGYKIA